MFPGLEVAPFSPFEESSVKLRLQPSNCNRRCLGILAVSFGLAFSLLGGGSAARADLVINPIFDSSITSNPNAATIESTINAAIQVYETRFSNSITVSIRFVNSTDPTVLGESQTAIGTLNYSDWTHAMTVTGHGSPFIPTGAVNPVDGSSLIDVTSANLRALGFSVNTGGQPDSIITLNTSLMNLDRTSINPTKYDLMAVASHEIDEALGTGSGLNGGNVRPEDLFRYSSPGVRSYTTSSAATSYFSIDGGQTNLVNFNQVGNGSDFGDWATSATHRVQDAFGTPGATPNLGVELTALSAIGYDLNAVPEPASMALMGVGALTMSVIGLRRRKRQVA
jgi:hypothetical protein